MASNGIFGFHPEDVIDVIYAILPDIEALKKDIDTILGQQDIKPIIERNPEFPFQESKRLSVEEVKAKLKSDILLELDYYTKRLNKLENEMEIKLQRLGTNKFANAGKKIRFNLTVEEIGCLFGLLEKFKLIKTADNKEISKRDLAEFLSKNFMSSSRKGEFGVDYLHDHLKPNNDKSRSVSKLLTKFQKELNS
jgi:hypothetical protein